MVGSRKRVHFAPLQWVFPSKNAPAPVPAPTPAPAPAPALSQPPHGYAPDVAWAYGQQPGSLPPGLLHHLNPKCIFVLEALSFYSPFDISKATVVREHRYSPKGGLYVAETPYPLVPGIDNEVAVRVTVRDDMKMVVHLAASGRMPWGWVPPADELDRFQTETPVLYFGQRVFIEIEDSMHGQWLAAAMKAMGACRMGAASRGFYPLRFDAHLHPDPEIKLNLRPKGPYKPDRMDTSEAEMAWPRIASGDPTKWWMNNE